MIRLRKYLLPEGGKFYKANLHCHTTISDGDLTDKELKKAYKEQGYSVVAFTDHDICVSHHELTDKDFVALTAYEADISNWIVDDSNFVRCYHFNCYATTDGDGYSTVPKPGYGSIDAINDYISRLRDAGYIVCYNHPNWSLQTFEDYGGLKGLFAMEIFNYSAMLDGIDANHEMPYDCLLYTSDAADEGLGVDLGGRRILRLIHNDKHRFVKRWQHYRIFNKRRFLRGDVSGNPFALHGGRKPLHKMLRCTQHTHDDRGQEDGGRKSA